MARLTLGEPVEVHLILASGGVLEAPIKSWSAGYVLQGIIDNLAVVKQVKPGVFEGCLTNYDLEDVRQVG